MGVQNLSRPGKKVVGLFLADQGTKLAMASSKIFVTFAYTIHFHGSLSFAECTFAQEQKILKIEYNHSKFF